MYKNTYDCINLCIYISLKCLNPLRQGIYICIYRYIHIHMNV